MRSDKFPVPREFQRDTPFPGAAQEGMDQVPERKDHTRREKTRANIYIPKAGFLSP
jgi:hypothetical protein